MQLKQFKRFGAVARIAETWRRQRRLVDPALEQARVKESFARMREAGLPPTFATVIAWVPPPSSETELLVIVMMSVPLPGMPTVAPGPLALELPIENWMPFPPLPEMLFEAPTIFCGSQP